MEIWCSKFDAYCQMDTGQITLVSRGLALPAPILLLTLDKLRRSKQFQLHLLHPHLLFVHLLLFLIHSSPPHFRLHSSVDKCRRSKQFSLHLFPLLLFHPSFPYSSAPFKSFPAFLPCFTQPCDPLLIFGPINFYMTPWHNYSHYHNHC